MSSDYPTGGDGAPRWCRPGSLSSSGADEQLKCPLCRRLLTSDLGPVLLQCGHSFCRQCVDEMPTFGVHPAQLAKEASANGTVTPIPAQLAPTPMAEAGDDNEGGLSRGRWVRWPATRNECECAIRHLHIVSRDQSLISMPRLVADWFLPSRLSHRPTIEPRPTTVKWMADHGRPSPCAGGKERAWSPASAGFLLCLLCRTRTEITGHPLSSALEVNHGIGAAADRHLHRLSHCADCENADSHVFCHDCAMFLCEPCSKRIHQGAKTSRHGITSLADGIPDHSTTLPPKCSLHGHEDAILFCYTCQYLVCVVCAYGEHKGHSVSLLKDAVRALKQNLSQMQIDLSKQARSLGNAAKRLQKDVASLEMNAVSAKHLIRTHFELAVSKLVQLQNSMLEDVDRITRDKDDQLTKQWYDLIQSSNDLKLRAKLCSEILQQPESSFCLDAIRQQLSIREAILNQLPHTSPCVPPLVPVNFLTLCSMLRDLSDSIALTDESEAENPTTGLGPPILSNEPDSLQLGDRETRDGVVPSKVALVDADETGFDEADNLVSQPPVKQEPLQKKSARQSRKRKDHPAADNASSGKKKSSSSSVPNKRFTGRFPDSDSEDEPALDDKLTQSVLARDDQMETTVDLTADEWKQSESETVK